ncbi:leucine-rich repeat-containing protein 16C [Platysternon megacephalum]|uniref:Leucine-rich repeat-containing protein 16C n=1 Tax=Platysternon megacephalum TaxID=55544 RepID=A0A4D9DPW6_9SAUR|nr:leucine-rich repeat-containing protein 16C [Platysternon megacephalum]
MAATEPRRRGFRQRPPPFLKYLQSILRKYPDGGQILKELIQNADDAGATEVIFLCDERRYGTQSLAAEGLQRAQGPALVAYNDGLFSEADWDGIQSTGDSHKLRDPGTVGRFGLGFNSVYHLTDLPAVLSGPWLGVLDPQRAALADGGQQWHLEEAAAELADQFAPFWGALEVMGRGEGSPAASRFPGTLFRFPLRHELSGISDNLYSPERVRQLFLAFIHDAPTCLLFLRHVRRLALKMVDGQGATTELLETTAAPRPLNGPGSVQDNVAAAALATAACIKAVAARGTAADGGAEREWLVVSAVPTEGAFPELAELAGALGSLPGVALAYPLRGGCAGHLCCFLPLPATEENATGLPLHINAPFHLTDDRRHVQWAEEDRGQDHAARWNQLLTEVVLPLAYRQAVVVAAAACPDDPYGAWPDPELSRHQQRYRSLAERICQQLWGMEALVPAGQPGPRRLQAADAVFLPQNEAGEPTLRVLEDALVQAGEPLATVPAHVRRALAAGGPAVKEATPAYVRKVLGRVGPARYPADKRLLLEYVAGDQRYGELAGLELLPRADGGFACFGGASGTVYADSEAFPRILLPGLADSFLPEDLTPALLSHLHRIAEQGLFRNLVSLDLTVIKQNLKDALPADWFKGGSAHVTWCPGDHPHQPPCQWLAAFWDFLEHHVRSLALFEGHPLVPLTPLGKGARSLQLARLSPTPTLLFRSWEGRSLTEDESGVLEALGCTVIHSWDQALWHRQLIDYVLAPTAGNALRAFDHLGVAGVAARLRSLPPDRSRILCQFLSQAPASSLSDREAVVLGSLPIFQKIPSVLPPCPAGLVAAGSYQALERSTVPAVPEDLVLPEPVLRCRDEADRRLLLQTRDRLLGAAELALLAVRAVKKGVYAKRAPDAERLMLWVLRHGDALFGHSKKLQTLCEELAFMDRGGTLACANELFDPQNMIFRALLGPRCFPPMAFREAAVLRSLCALGLKTSETAITPDHMLEAAQEVGRLQQARDAPGATAKSRALIDLCNRTSALGRFCQKKLQRLRDLAWVPATDSTERQLNGPFLPPERLRSARYTGLAGLAMPLTDTFREPAEEKLGLSRPPPAEKVLVNLLLLAQGDQPKDIRMLLPKLHVIYQHMQQNLRQFQGALSHAVVWTGNGFSVPAKVVLAYPDGLDLSCLVPRVPQELLPYRRLFLAWGARDAVGEEELSQALCRLGKEIEGRPGGGTEAELRLTVAILDWLKSRGHQGDRDLPVPVQAPGGSGFTLRPASSALYCDIDRASLADLEGDDAELAVVHEAVAPATATFLGVALLSTRVLQPQLFEAWGPSEPITTRIWNILREYTEEADLFKELIQNAEDAGARACSFLLDLRRHGGGTARLLDPGMAACHGPALWSYNDAAFTQEDLVNIIRVGAATKEGQEGKIGRFGLGFNTVYHVTDVPSVLSGSSLLIFDPNVTHLRKHIPNPACPGIRLDLRQRPATLTTFAEQFRPYRGLFGFQTQEPFDFPGTLFRLPFRTEEEARESRISQVAFGVDRVERLQSGFRDFCHLLLLFLRGVREVSLKRLPNQAPSPEATQSLATLCRERIKSLEDAEDSRTGQSSIEQLTVQWESDRTISHYLVHTCHGTGESLVLFQQGMRDGTRPSPPSAGVALPLAPTEPGKWAPHLDGFEGHVFCFLPLPIASGLPVHLHGAFAVLSNRKGLWDATAKGEWNWALLRDAVPAAWLQALSLLRDMHQEGDLEDYEYHTFWPDAGKARHPFTEAAKAFYHALADGRDLALFSDGRQWCTVNNARFLDFTITRNTRVGQTAARVFANLLPEPLLAVQLPNWVRSGFQASGQEDTLLPNTYDWVRFYQKIVFANVGTLDAPDRDALILHALDMGDATVDQLLASVSCIPTTPRGQLQPIGKLVHPQGRAAPLYNPQDGRFPTGTGFLAPERLLRLEGLGMAKDVVSMKELLERAHTVQALWQRDQRQGCRRICCILELLEQLLEQGLDNTAQVAFRAVPFLPAALPGARHELCRPTDLYHHKHRSLVGLIQPVLASKDLGGDFRFSKALQDFLGLSRKPPAGMVLRQLAEACQGSNALPKLELQETARQCYAYLDKLLSKQPTCKKEVAEKAAAFSFVLVGAHFVPVKAVARELSFEASPYLHQLPQEYWGFKALWGCVGLQETFTLESYMGVLRDLAGKTAGRSLSPQELQLVLRLVTTGLMEASSDRQPVGAYEAQGIFFPDQQGVLRPVAKLHFDDTPWLPREEGTPLCHGRIPRELALHYGVPTTRHRALVQGKIRGLELAPWASEFGAREELTVRLRNILREYSSSSRDVLKELLQNADDAGASRIHFVWDRRRHPAQRVISEEWGGLQGPALCVYNDTPLTQEDIEGIQRLGVGGKGGRQDKTGKYGLGFNAVFHLTDCPAFMTGDSALGVFDPHLRYVPTASEQYPGAMFSVNGHFKKTFPDVYATFLPDLFDLSQGVLFRLPLRTAEGAASSRVCQRVIHEEVLEQMQEALAQEAESLVLFLRHLRTVVFSEITEDRAQLRELLRVETEMEEGSLALRRAFQERLSHMAVSGSEETTPVRVVYTMKVSHGRSRPPTSWGVVWQAGVDDAAKKESPDPERLPYGAVAACLDAVRPGRAFCTLPLPLETGLPVHINGNFLVDSARRDLCKEDGGSRNTAWNGFLMQRLLAPLYCRLLDWLRKKLGETLCFMRLQACLEMLEPKYLSYFPAVRERVPPPWHQLVNGVYELIAEMQQPLIPIYQTETTRLHVHSVEMVRITWTATGEGHLLQEPFFLQEEACDSMSHVLQRLKMKLVPAFQGLRQIHAEFIRAGVKVLTLNPGSLCCFLKALPLDLPCRVLETPLKDPSSCSLLLEFCLEELRKEDVGDLEGLPLSVTHDGMLRPFSTREPVFQSRAHCLFPRQRRQFLAYHSSHKPLLLQAGFLKAFTLQEAARFIQEVLGQPDWEAQSAESQKWLKEVWELFNHMIYKANERKEEAMSKAFRELVSLFEYWAILPVCSDQPGDKRLVPLVSLPTIIHSYSSDVEKSLGKLGFAKLDSWMIPHEISFHCIRPRLLQTHDPVSVLKQLAARTGLRWCELKSYETIGLLRFLTEKVKELEHDLLAQLRSLPLFQTHQGTWVALAFYDNVYILETRIPKPSKDLQALYQLDQQTVLLQDNPLHRGLPKSLGIGVLNDLQQFIRHLLPRLPRLPESQLLEALRLLFSIQSHYREEYPAEKKTIASAFGSVSFIRDKQGVLHPASYFYDGEVLLFQTMRLEARFVPEAFFQELRVEKFMVNSFLCDVGMKREISEDDFVEFATWIERQAGQEGAVAGDLPAQRKALLSHLLSESSDSLSDRFLERVSSIRFLAPQTVPADLGNFHPPCVLHTQPVALQGALVVPWDEDVALVWTSAVILAVPLVSCTKNAQSVLERLGVLQAVPAPVVLDNLKNVCQARCETKEGRKTRTRVFMKTYGYLERDLRGFDADRLAGLPVVLVKEEQVAEASQVVFSLRHEQEFRPYLYTVPPLVAVYSELLQKLGVEQEPSIRHYAQVLRRIHQDTQDKETLQPNLTKTVLRATQHLFQLLSQGKADFSGVEELHLPCTDGKLYRSNTLVFSDCAPADVSQALESTFRFLVDLSRCHLLSPEYDPWKLVRQLPQPLRPQLLSEITELQLEEDSLELCPYGEFCESRNQLHGILVSPEFREGLAALLRWQRWDEEEEAETARREREVAFSAERLEMVCCEKIQTVMMHRGERLEGSQDSRVVHVVLHADGRRRVYLLHQERMDLGQSVQILGSLVQEVDSIMGGMVRWKSMPILMQMLACKDPGEVLSVLARNGVPLQPSTHPDAYTLPSPGTEIPQEWYDSLDMSILNTFAPGDYVGYLDPAAPEERYQYAVVLEVLPDGAVPMYRIDLGAGRQEEVSANDLYQFKRIQVDGRGRALVLVPDQQRQQERREAWYRQSLGQVKEEVDTCLAKIWELPEGERRKAIRRLYLRYHPDKNVGQEEMANEVCKYLRERIQELEEGRKPRAAGNPSSPQASGGRRHPSSHRGFSASWNEWDGEARRHRQSRGEFTGQRDRGFHYDFWSYHRAKAGRRPQAEEAGRWLRQAQSDLRAAGHDVGQRCTNWVFYKVHRAVEKALAAAVYDRGERFEREQTLAALAQKVAAYEPGLEGLPAQVAELRRHGVDDKTTQYPSYHPPPTIPNEAFPAGEEQQVLRLAQGLLDVVQAHVARH